MSQGSKECKTGRYVRCALVRKERCPSLRSSHPHGARADKHALEPLQRPSTSPHQPSSSIPGKPNYNEKKTERSAPWRSLGTRTSLYPCLKTIMYNCHCYKFVNFLISVMFHVIFSFVITMRFIDIRLADQRLNKYEHKKNI